MQQDPIPTEPMIARPKWMRLIEMNSASDLPANDATGLPPHGQAECKENEADNASRNDIAMQPTLSMKSVSLPPLYDVKNSLIPDPFHMQLDTDISDQITAHLMQLSGRMPAIHVPKQPQQQSTWSVSSNNDPDAEEGYWPDGIQQTGPLPVINLYGSEPFGRTQPLIAVVTPSSTAQVKQQKQQPAWKTLLGSPAVKVTIGLLIGIGLLFLVSRFVDFPTTIRVIQQSLSTPRGIILALLSGIAFLIAFSIRGMRWKLFLNPIGKVSTFKAIQLFLVGIFLNFLLPIRGGEVAKTIMLKRVANIPISRSLPTVAMDKALDLMPALFIMAIVPLLGVRMDIKLWLVLATVGGLPYA